MSDYIKHTWEDGEVIDASKLNNIEAGIAEAKKAAEINETGIAEAKKAAEENKVDTDTLAPKYHAAAGGTYGVASDTLFGHVRLSDSADPTLSAMWGAHAATPAAVHAVQQIAEKKAPAYSYGTEDLTAGTSELETGKLHFVYE